MRTVYRISILVTALLAAIAVSGCQSNNAEMQSQIDELRSQLDDANSSIQELQRERGEETSNPPAADTEPPQSDSPEREEGEAPDPEPAPSPGSDEGAAASDAPVIDLGSNGQTSLTGSSSFVADAGQTLTLEVKSSIQGGTVDFFLFSPSGREQKFTFSGDDTQTIALTAGTWAYNCTGFFTGGEITIVGTLH